jgi:hypothetical protein
MSTGQSGRQGGPSRYEIRLQGRLDPRWATWFDGMTLTGEVDTTVLRGPVVDQSALHGILARLRDLGLPLLSVRPIDDQVDDEVDDEDQP